MRALVGDGNMDGEVTLADALLAKNKVGLPVIDNRQCDLNLNGAITLADALLARGRLGKQALCP